MQAWRGTPRSMLVRTESLPTSRLPTSPSIHRLMRLRRLALLLALIAPVAAHAQAAAPATPAVDERPAVLAVVKALFDGMRKGDSAAVRAVFHPEAQLSTAGIRNGTPAFNVDS